MRLRHLLLLAGIFFSIAKGYSQISNFPFAGAGDSLSGFDESSAIKALTLEGLTGDDLKGALINTQRAYINTKYDLYEKPVTGNPPSAASKQLGGGAVINGTPCVNEGFENGNLTGWTAHRGGRGNVNSNVYPTFTAQIVAGAQVNVVTTPFNDLWAMVPNSPFSGNKVVRINSQANVSQSPVIRIQQSFPVTASNFLYEFAFFAIMQDAGPPNPHTCNQTPYMAVKIRDVSTGNLLSCPQFSFAAPASGGGCAGFGPVTWTPSTTSSLVMVSNGWQRFAIDLTSWISGNVNIEVYVAHCSLGGHWGYAYFDSNCNSMNLTVNGTDWPMPNLSITPTVGCGSTATVAAPSGLGPYSWNGPSGSGITGVTTRTFATTTPGAYTLQMTPPYVCNNFISRVVNLAFVPPVAITAAPATICATGPNTVSLLSASGASSYTWLPSGPFTSTNAVSPSATTIYSVAAQTGTCSGTFTTQVNVAPSPTVFATVSNATVCSGGSTTLTALGAGTYTWMPGNLTGSQVAVNPTTSTVYTVTGSNGSGCQDSYTVPVSVTGAFTVGTFPATSPTVCAGTPVMVVGIGGATSFTWYPTNPLVTTQVAALTPSITTQYTVVGANGSCTNSAVHTITVDPGPAMVLSATPSITCPGVNATLTANAPASLGFTWTPGTSTSSTQVVNPAVSTVYGVTGINASGCRSTYTINKLVAPLPVITINPATPTVCVGSSIVLTANGGSSYTWTPGNVFTNTILVSPTVNTTFSVAASNGTCTSNSSVLVSVVPLPTVNATASPTAICRGASTTLSATGAGSYTWFPMGSSGSSAVVSPTVNTTYTVIGNSGGCTSSRTVMVTVNPLPTITPAANPASVCPGACSTLSATGANTYTFSGGNVVCPVSTTVYSVTGTSTAGCISATAGTVMVTVNPAPNIVLSPASASICAGGSVTINASGASTFTWNPGNLTGSSRLLSPAVTTIYTVTGTSALGCIGQRTIQITVVPNPTVTAFISSPTVCAGSSVTLSAIGATNYTWMPGSLTGGTVNTVPASSTTYTVTGNTAGCSAPAIVAVTVHPRPNITANAAPASVCPGFCSTITPSGGSSYTFLPSGPVVCPGSTTTYTINGVNGFGCTDLTPAQVVVTVNPPASFTLTASSPSVCQGGTVSLSASGASSYTWLPGTLIGSTIVVSPTVNTTYTATGTNAAGCTATRTISIIVVPSPTVNASASPASICSGSSSTLSATGASGYNWMPGNLNGTPVTVSPASTTVYTVTGSTSGCTATRTVAVSVTPSPTISVVANPASICSGASSTLMALGASSYVWNPGGMNGGTVVVTPASTTNYTVTGTTGVCTGSATVNVNVTTTPTVAIAASAATVCSGGPVTFTGSGAATYTWMPGNINGQIATFNPTTNTTYTVTGANGNCTDQHTVSVIVIPTGTISVSANPTSICAGQSATLTATGATSYSWAPMNVNTPAVVVSPTITTMYSVFGHNLGCPAISAFLTLTVNPVPSITVTASSPSICAGSSVTLTASGASSYTWIPGSVAGSPIVRTPSVTTTYTVTGSNGGCTGQNSIMITVVPVPNVNASANPATVCAGSSSTLSATGAANYIWNPGNLPGSPVVVNPSSPTVYTVTGTTAGCSSQRTVQVNVNPLPNLNASANFTSICAGQCSTLSATGASGYTWNPGSLVGSNVQVCPAVSTVFTVTGASAAGCSTTRTVSIVVNPNPTVVASPATTTVCAGLSTMITISGVATHTFIPGGMMNNPVTVAPLVTTVYTISGTSAQGCNGVATATVFVNPVPVVNVNPPSATLCVGGCSTLTATGAANYVWSNGALSPVTVVCPTVNTTYSVVGTTAGCSSNPVGVAIVVNPQPTIAASASPSTICLGNTTTLSASGASSYTWMPGNLAGSQVTVAPLNTTVYTVTGTSAFGCSSVRTVTVVVNPVPNPGIIASTNSVCPGLFAVLTATGGLIYQWQPGGMTNPIVTVTPSVTTTYSVAVTNIFGCTKTATTTINVIPPPNVQVSATSTQVCAGKCVTLTASGASTYTWLPGFAPGATIVQCPTVTTTYTVVGQQGFCANFTLITIQVNPLPAVSVTANPVQICAGMTSSLVASGAVTYTWMPGNLNGSAIAVAPLTTTNYTVTGSNGTCTNAATALIMVNPAASISVTANPTLVCAGKQVTLAAAGGTSYTWAPIVSNATVVATAVNASTTYTVFGANGPAGCPGSATVFVQMQPNPVISTVASPTAVCPGNCAVISATGANSYTWFPGSTNGSTMSLCSPNTSYAVIGAVGSCTATTSGGISILPAPSLTVTASSPAICPGGSATLSVGGASSYSWSPISSTLPQVIVNPSSTTVYTVRGFSGSGCSSTATISIQVNPNPVVSISGPSSMCAGQLVPLTATGAASYTWQPGSQTGSQVAVSPLSTTVYTVTGSSNNCTATAFHSLAVNPLPVINPLANPASICIGGTSTLSATGAQTYTWSTSVVASSTTVSPLSNSTYTVSGTSAAGCVSSQTVGVTVNNLPSINVSSTSNTICAGTSATLTASGTISYTWLPMSSGGSVVVVTPANTTTYTVIGSNGPACTNTVTFVQYVSPIPSITLTAASASVCEGFTTSLNAGGATSYTFEPGGITTNPAVVTVTANTIYTVTGSTAGCGSTATVAVNAAPLPTVIAAASPTSVCIGGTVNLSASGASTYTWFPGGQQTAVINLTPAVTAQYTVSGKAANGCSNADIITVPVLPLPNLTLTASSPSACLGSAVTITASGASIYLWAPGNLTGSTVTVSPTSPTTYTVFGNNGACTGSTTINIGINFPPVVSASANPTVLCGGLPVNLSASGAISYSWMPGNLTGANVVDNPTVSTTYTVSGEDANGCVGVAFVSVLVNPSPTISPVATPTGMCAGSLVTVTLTAGGTAQTYTWLPFNSTVTTITDSPTVTTTYTLTGTDAIGCVGTQTVTVGVFPIPIVTITPPSATMCAGSTVTLTAAGANNYTWLPSGGTTSVESVSPLISTTYTVIADNGGICMDTLTVDVFVNPLPANVVAAVSGTITCASPTVSLSGSSTGTNVSYSWAGPGGYTSTVQNPTVTAWGVFTLSVTDNTTGCSATATVDVPTDNSIPSVSIVASGSITCSNNSVMLNAVHSTSNAAYTWNGPGSFTASVQNVTVTTAGDYTIVVTDLTSSCTGSAVVTVGTHTAVSITASIAAATCSAGVSLNDGTIMAGNFGPLDRFDLVAGSSYTGSLTYTSAITIPVSGIITSNLANPSDTVTFTLRVFDSLGCVKDFTLDLIPQNCLPRVLGIAKAVSTPTANSALTEFDVVYTLKLKNYDTLALSTVSVTENLMNVFPSPATFTIVQTPSLTGGSGIVLNSSFDGSLDTDLTETTSNLAAKDSAEIRFTVRFTPNGFFGPFTNTVLASASTSLSGTARDISNNGLNPDPDGDGNPLNNNEPTVFTLSPQLFFGLTKTGSYVKLQDNSYDVSFTVTVHNLGNDTLHSVDVTDSLFNQTIPAPATYTIKGSPVASGQLVANSGFDGRSDIHLLDAASRIAPGETSRVSFTINVVPDTVTVIINSAFGSAVSNWDETQLTDISNNGDDPDTNNNFVWNEEEDNVPTVIVLPPLEPARTYTLFVPEGFSPDGDGINDLFVIRGLPSDGDNSITIFNRWGNRVYHHGNYNNSWNGHPNVAGTFGKDKLPPGTYYYVLEMKGTGESRTGFIVIQH